MMKYECFLENIEKSVYDGDTIKDVWILLSEGGGHEPDIEIFPTIWRTDRGVETQIDIRLFGIDTPEKRASTKNADGTRRAEEDRQREKKASEEARQELIRLLKENGGRFHISNLQEGKYAGRVVADVDIADIDVATHLIDQGHAIAYHGGTKVPFEEWYGR